MISKLDINIIDTHSFKTLGFLDASIYNEDIIAENATIEIVPPGFKIAARPFFMIKGLNVYNSNNVGITKASCKEDLVDLPDGIWKYRYSVCPNDKLFIDRFFLKTDKLQCKYTQAFLTLDLENINEQEERQKRRILEESEIYLEGAIAAANDQNSKLSSDLYIKANKLLNNFLENQGGCKC